MLYRTWIEARVRSHIEWPSVVWINNYTCQPARLCSKWTSQHTNTHQSCATCHVCNKYHCKATEQQTRTSHVKTHHILKVFWHKDPNCTLFSKHPLHVMPSSQNIQIMTEIIIHAKTLPIYRLHSTKQLFYNTAMMSNIPGMGATLLDSHPCWWFQKLVVVGTVLFQGKRYYDGTWLAKWPSLSADDWMLG